MKRIIFIDNHINDMIWIIRHNKMIDRDVVGCLFLFFREQ